MSAMGPSLRGARVLDLFAGSGALGLECLSRGAESVTFVEIARGALRALEENVATLGCRDQIRIVSGDAMRFVRQLEPGVFDLAVADPPYGRGLAGELLLFHQSIPFAAELWVEHHSREELPPLSGLHQRRYGDTTLSTLHALTEMP